MCLDSLYTHVYIYPNLTGVLAFLQAPWLAMAPTELFSLGVCSKGCGREFFHVQTTNVGGKVRGHTFQLDWELERKCLLV